MSEDLNEEMKKLKEEIAKLKEQLKNVMGRERERRRGIYIDVGDRVHDYIEDVMEGVAEGIHGELEKSIFIGPRGVRIARARAFEDGNGYVFTVTNSASEKEHYRRKDRVKISFPKVAGVMSALGHEHRLRVLDELMSGGKYINELQERLSEITTSTLASHLKVLEEAGLVVQEKVRGRYLITIPGRSAYKMARRVTRFLEGGNQE